MRKFSQGGDEGLEDYENKAMPKRYSALDELASGKEKGSFDEDVYERARKFVNRGGSSAAPAAKAKPASKPTSKPAAAGSGRAGTGAPASADYSISSQGGRAVIPGGGRETEVETPTPASRMREGVSDTAKKALAASGALSLGAAGLGIGYKAYKASDAAKRAKIAKAIREGAESAPVTGGSTAARTTSETGRKFGPKAEMEAAESTMRGAVSRKGIQAKRAAAERARGQAETMERNKPVMQATPKKSSPRDRTREDREPDYELRARGGSIKGYDNGGSVRGGGCERQGKTRGRFV
jgi:hypothetical protein